MPRSTRSLYLRNIIFGVEDSLVSTVGLLSGIAISTVTHQAILVTGFVYITVEAFSMSVGSYLSEESAEEYESGQTVRTLAPILGALVMFISFFVAGFFPILPYLMWVGANALAASVGLSVTLLAVLGFVSARLAKVNPWRRALRMAILGGLAIAIGIVVAKVVPVS